MRRNTDRSGNYNLALLDMLFAMCLAYAILFMISLLMVKPAAPPTESNVKLSAQLLITMTWPDDSMDDIDLWVQLPDGRKVWYQSPSGGSAALERDDLGALSDIVPKSAEDQTMEWIKLNKEIITIRANTPGRYVVAGHVFKVHTFAKGFSATHPLPYEIKFEAVKLNPTAKIIATGGGTVYKTNDRVTAFAFTIDGAGDVVSVEMSPADEIVALQPRGEGGP